MSLDVFGALSQLEFLDLSNCSGFTGTLEPLRHLVNLRQLSLAGCVRLTGGVEPVSRLMSLKILDLEACAALGGSLDDLHGLRNLEKLNVCDTPLVGAEAFAAKHLGGAGRRCQCRCQMVTRGCAGLLKHISYLNQEEPRHLKTEKKRLLNRNYRKPGPSDLYIGRDAFRSMRALFGAVFGVPHHKEEQRREGLIKQVRTQQ